MIEEILNAGELEHKSSGKFSISGIGTCRRKKFLALWKKYKETFSNQNMRVFNVGDFIHREAVRTLMTNSPSQGFEVVATEVNIPFHKYFSGRIDCIMSKVDDGKRMIVDFKSCGKWTMNKVKSGEVSQSYIDQVNLYMYLTGIHEGYLLFVCKDNSEYKEVKVEYDEERAKELEEEIKNFFEEYVFKGILPPKCDGGTFGCEVCGGAMDEEVFKFKEEIQQFLKEGGKYQDLYGE